MPENKFKNEMVQRIKEAGQEIIDRAEQMVGDNDLITNVSIHVYFNQPLDTCPTIEWTTEVINKNSSKRLLGY